MTAQELVELRRRLMMTGYAPIPIIDRSKRPAIEKGWQTHLETNEAEIELWSRVYPGASGTGLLCRFMPSFDIDILDAEAAEAVEMLARARFEEQGRVLVRIGQSPKRAIPFRAAVPFKKISASLIAPNADPEKSPEQKLEILADGQQIVAFGLHAKTGEPYRWFGGEPGDVELCELPYIEESVAQILIDDAVALLCREHGYRAAPTRRRKAADGNGQDASAGSVHDWSHLTANILAGRELHDSLRDLAAKMAKAGTKPGAIVNHLRGLMDAPTVKDDRWKARYDDIPRLVAGADKFREPEPEPEPEPQPEPPPDWNPPEQPPVQDESAPGDNNPVDLWGSFEPPELPRGLLPKLIEEYAVEQGATMGVDPGGVAMAALAVCAAAIPDRIRLLMKQHSLGWRESARLWVILVGMPSTKKSPIIAATVGPLAKLDAILVNKYLAELKQWEQLDKNERKTEPRPVQKRLRLEDTTIEAAQEALAGSSDGILVVQDELSGFFGAMDKYGGHRGAAKDRGFWLQSFNGGQYSVSRIVRGVGLIPNLSVCMLGGIQPDVIRRLSAESQDDGFLQRMLVVVLRPAGIGLDVPRPSVVRSYAELVEKLTKLKPPVSGSFNDDHEDLLRLDDQAHEIRRKLEAEHHAIECVEAINPKLAAHVGKYGGLFGRLCVTFHCIEHAGDKYLRALVSKDTANRVANFMGQFLTPHALAFYGGILGLSNDHDRLANVAGYILAHKIEHLTNRDIQRSCRNMRKLERRDTEVLFEQLEALGWVSRIPGPRPSSPPHWLVNPRVHEKFAERAKTEIERRKKVQAVILDLAGRKKGR